MEEEKMMPVDAARSEGDAACAPVCRCDVETPEEGDARPESALEAEVERLKKDRHEWVLLYGKADKSRDEWKAMYEEMAAERDEWRERYDSVLEGRNRWSGIADGIYRRFYPREEYCMPNDPTDMINKAVDAIERERDKWKRKAEARSAKRAAAVERLKDARYHTIADYVRAMLGWGHEPHFEDCRDALIDLLADGETNGIADGTNVIAPDSPLADDVVAIMRKAAKGYPGDTGDVMENLKLMLDMPEGACDYVTICSLADRVERDYVRRGGYDFAIEMLKCMKADRDELKAFSERLETAAHDNLGVTLFGVDYVTEEFMLHVRDTLTAERDEWKAKAEGSSKVRAGSSKSAERAAAIERVRKAKDAGTSIGYAIVGREYYPGEAYETLIDLLTDEPMDAQRDNDGTCPIDDRTCPNGKATEHVTNLEWLYEHDEAFAYGAKQFVVDDGYSCCETLAQAHEWLIAPHEGAQSKTEPILTEQPESLSDESCRQYADQGEREEAHDGESDSREKLEADILAHYKTPKEKLKTVREWLDRQAAMTERYWKAQVDALASKGDQLADANAELSGEVKRQRKVIKAQAESFRKLEAEGCSCPEVIEHLEDGITVGVSVDGIEYVRETGRMRDLKEENRNLHRELSRLNEQVRGTRQLPKKCKWPRKDGKLVKIAPTQAREIAFDRTGGWIRWSDSEKDTTRFKYGEEL